MVTAQSVTGTGVISEISSSFSDFFGMQSNKLNSKLKNGENICRAELRIEAFRIGANAIIGTDIDYAEVGGDKGMLMVCMSGTAVKLNNPEIISDELSEKLQKLINVDIIIKDLQQYQSLHDH
ncbi:heavy metal-binding domain-containing protein [bacterium]|nr:MAG: heavy metal-binding domain-containing protein [bacterium]